MANQKVLIVDDSKTIRMQVREMLPQGNFEVLEAGDGKEGLDMIQREVPSLVLLDFFMPRMNGWEVVKSIQADARYQSIPIVMMSGRREDVEQTAPELFNYFEFVGKPFESSRLMQAVRAAMAKAKQRQLVPAPRGIAPSQSDRPVASQTPPADANTAALHHLKSEIGQLRQENARLKSEVEGLKKQVAQILTFLRQKMR